MRELTKSLTSLSWAMSLFGARQMLNVMNPGEAARAFETVTRATEEQLGDSLRSMFRAGDRLQRSMVDATFGLMTGGGVWDPTAWTDATRRAAGCSGEALGRRDGVAGGVARPRAAADAAPGAGAGPGWGPVPG